MRGRLTANRPQVLRPLDRARLHRCSSVTADLQQKGMSHRNATTDRDLPERDDEAGRALQGVSRKRDVERHVGATLMTRNGIGFALAW